MIAPAVLAEVLFGASAILGVLCLVARAAAPDPGRRARARGTTGWTRRRVATARYKLAWAHSSPVRPEDLPRAEAELPPLPDEDDLTISWVGDLTHPIRRVRATTWALAALTRHLATARPRARDHANPMITAASKPLSDPRWPHLDPVWADDTHAFSRSALDELLTTGSQP